MQFFLFRKGPLAVGASYVCGFIKSDSHLETPNLQFHVSPASTDLLGKSSLHKFPAFTPTITNVRPTSRGSIELQSSDTRVSPKIKMNYLSTDEDREIAGKSLKIVREIVMNSKAYKEYQPEELRPGIDITDNETLATEAGKFANTIFHPVSTCRMGNDENAVVNDRLIAHGFKNLRIVDASVMPHITSGNTNAPTIMIAEKAADMILEDSKIMTEEIIIFFEIVFIDLVLAGDNAIIIGMVASQFQADQRKKIIFYGIGAAVILRIIFTLITAYLLQINGLRLIGGILLLYIVYKLYIDVIKNSSENEKNIKVDKSSLPKAITTVIIADVTMSLDNVLGVAGAAKDHYILLIFGLVLSIVLMATAATLISKWIKKYRWIAWLGILAILVVAIDLIYTDLKIFI